LSRGLSNYKCCHKFGDCYYDETYHYLIEQHLNYLDIPRLTALRIFENIHHPGVKILTLYFLLFAELPPHISLFCHSDGSIIAENAPNPFAVYG
jgi:hypothetical protein